MPDVLYSNYAQIRASFFDFTFRFFRVSEVKDLDDGKVEPMLEEMVRVQMSPQHAKSLLLALKSNIEKYESTHGEIRIPNTDGTEQPIGER